MRQPCAECKWADFRLVRWQETDQILENLGVLRSWKGMKWVVKTGKSLKTNGLRSA